MSSHSLKLHLRLLLISLSIIPHGLHGQQQLPYVLPTPQAVDLGKYGDLPVSLYSGAVSFSIPVLSTEIRDVKLDIHLDYDGSGIRVNSLPGPVGYGWTLVCGGAITRSVNGEYDEHIQSAQEQSLFGEVKRYFDISTYPQTKWAAMSEELMENTVWQNPGHDYQPDVFYFNFMGKSGRFFLDSNGHWQVCSEHNLEVLLDITDESYFDYPLFEHFPGVANKKQSKTIKTIRMRDDCGNVYEFGGTDDNVEYSIGLLDMCEYNTLHSWNADCWYLSSVSDKYGNVLYRFTYERGPYVAQVSNSYQEIYCRDEGSMSGIPGFLPGGYSTAYSYSGSQNPFVTTVNAPVYLKKVECANGIWIETGRQYYPKTAAETFTTYYSTMAPLMSTLMPLTGWNNIGLPFYYLQTDDQEARQYQYGGQDTKLADPLSTTRPKIYTHLRIFGWQNDEIYYRMIYDYNPRMHLSGLEIHDFSYTHSSDTSRLASYQFRYDRYDHLTPDVSTRAADHWGYFDGRAYNLGTGDAYWRAFRQQRDPDTTCVKYGSLTSVVYPTGGEAVIAYEPHRFSRCVSPNYQSMHDTVGIAGGLRVKSVTLYDDTLRTHQLTRKEYRYERDDGSSSGELAAAPRYYWAEWGNPAANNSGSARLSLFRTASIVPLSNSFGTHIGYSRVEERNLDGSRTEYRFSNFDGNQDYQYYVSLNGGAPSPYDRPTDRGYRRGKLLSVSKYSTDGAISSTTSYSYGDGKEEMYCGYGLEAGLLGGWSSGATAFYVGSSYRLFYRDYDLLSEQTTVYPGGLITRKTYNRTSQDFTMNAPYTHMVGIRYMLSETIAMGADSITTSYLYPQQRMNVDAKAAKLAREEHDLRVLSKTVMRNGQEVSADSTVYTLKNIGGTTRPMPRYELGRSGGEHTDTLVEYQEYTATARPSKIRRIGEPVQYLYWGYHDNYLYARSYANHVAPLSFSDSHFFDRSMMLSLLKPFRVSHGSVPVTTYTYRPLLGLTSITDPTGVTTLYDYDRMFRLQSTHDLFNNTVTTYEYHFREP